jgi:hypothetical protein
MVLTEKQMSFADFIKPILKNLKEKGYSVTCELGFNIYENIFLIKLEVKDDEIKYVFQYASSHFEGIRQYLDTWLNYILGIQIPR